MFHTITTFIKKENVLCIAALLAVISMFFVPPSPAYLAYIDFRVLALLFCLMLVVAGFQSIGFFRYLGNRLLSGAKDTRTLCLLLTGLCFFSSMFITNDVALITFVPFAVLLFSMAEQTSLLIPVIVLQTIAANLGSMLTPVGNPQNLYLYSAFSLSMGSFLLSMLPVSALSALLLLLAIFLLPNTALSFSDDSDEQREASSQETAFPSVGKLITFTGLFAVCLLCVLRLIPWQAMLLFIIIAVFFSDKTLFASVDYFLLLTFVAFFLFIGNMERIPAVSSCLTNVLEGRELLLGVLLSQGISNVPAAILLSGFTKNCLPLLYGVNIGGLGTLIASLASLISYRLYGNCSFARKGKYLKTFTAYNLIFLVILYGFTSLLLKLSFSL